MIVLAILSLGHILETIDLTVVNVALPTIKTDLGFSNASLSWVVNAYSVAFGGFLLLCGRAGDLLGRRTVFIGGLWVFILASLLAGIAWNAPVLVVARAVQGFAAAAIGPMTLAMLASAFPEGKPRIKAIGIWGMLSGVSAAAGLLLGGVITQGPGWRWIFFINLPIGILLIVAALRFLDADRPGRHYHKFDVAGAVSATAGLSLLAYAIVQSNTYGWGSTRTVVLFAVAAALVVYFVLHEAFVASEPLLAISLFRNRSVSSANIVQVVVNSGMFVMFYLATLYLQEVLGYSALETGLAYVPMSLALVVFARLGTKLIPIIGTRYVVFIGGLVGAVSLALFATISADGTFLRSILGPSLLLSIGVALTFIPTTIAAVAGVPADQRGIASGMINVSRTVGGALGLAVVSTIALNHAKDLLASGTPQAEALTSGFRLGFAISAVLLVMASVLAVLSFPNVKMMGGRKH
jgi:EmrB/QacA subfamily drug resistance transporter